MIIHTFNLYNEYLHGRLVISEVKVMKIRFGRNGKSVIFKVRHEHFIGIQAVGWNYREAVLLRIFQRCLTKIFCNQRHWENGNFEICELFNTKVFKTECMKIPLLSNNHPKDLWHFKKKNTLSSNFLQINDFLKEE